MPREVINTTGALLCTYVAYRLLLSLVLPRKELFSSFFYPLIFFLPLLNKTQTNKWNKTNKICFLLDEHTAFAHNIIVNELLAFSATEVRYVFWMFNRAFMQESEQNGITLLPYYFFFILLQHTKVAFNKLVICSHKTSLIIAILIIAIYIIF